jgi:hypothetical protein
MLYKNAYLQIIQDVEKLKMSMRTIKDIICLLSIRNAKLFYLFMITETKRIYKQIIKTNKTLGKF